MKRSILGLLLIVGMSANLVAGERFVRENAKEVVVDTATNLMWQDNADAKTIKKSWNDAIDYCENLTLGGYSDWHLPNYNELWKLADRSRYNPALHQVFQNIVSGSYWSSTTVSGGTIFVDIIDFNNGNSYGTLKSNSDYVRCVRDND